MKAPLEALLTVDFRSDGPNTELILRHDHLTNPVTATHLKKGAWVKTLDQVNFRHGAT